MKITGFEQNYQIKHAKKADLNSSIPIANTIKVDNSSIISPSIKNLHAYNNISFGKRIEVHRMFGANLITEGAEKLHQAVFRLWAPVAEKITLEIRHPEDVVKLTKAQVKELNLRPSDKWAHEWHLNADSNDGKSIFVDMAKTEDAGVFEATSQLPSKDAMYRFILKDKDDKVLDVVDDPFGTAQKHIFSWSQVYDNNAFKWTDDNWVKGKDPRRVSSFANKPNVPFKLPGIQSIKGNLTPSGMNTLQIHIPTATDKGSMEAFLTEIDRIADEKIFNSILLMPVEGTYGKNWGYDGVKKYSVSRALGEAETQDDAIKRNDMLKKIVDKCHSKGLNVGFDIVPSHIFTAGPSMEDAAKLGIKNGQPLSGDTLNKLGKYGLEGKWGGNRFNLEDPDLATRSKVRDYVINMPLYWIDNFHIDFVRFDQTPEMQSNYAMKQMAEEIKHHFPHTVIQWEDHRVGDGLTRNLRFDEMCLGNTDAHCKFIENAERNNISLENIGGNEHWDFAFSHSLEAMLTGVEVDGYKPSLRSLADHMKDVGGTKAVQTHDEIGNKDGRIIFKVLSQKLGIYNQGVFKHGTNKEKQEAINGLVSLIGKYLFDKSAFDKEYSSILRHIKFEPIPKEKFVDVVNLALSRDKVGIGAKYMAPGSKLTHQGDEYGEINRLLFGRIQAFDEPALNAIKGYDMKKALDSSVIQTKKHKIDGIHKLEQDMSALMRRNPCMQTVLPLDKLDAMVYHMNENDDILGFKRFDFDGNEVLSIMNFGDKGFVNYTLGNSECFPAGIWKETINSNNAKYGGTGELLNSQNIYADGSTPTTISIPPNSVLVFEKIQPKKP